MHTQRTAKMVSCQKGRRWDTNYSELLIQSNQGLWDSLIGTGTDSQAWQPEFNTWSPIAERRELTSTLTICIPVAPPHPSPKIKMASVHTCIVFMALVLMHTMSLWHRFTWKCSCKVSPPVPYKDLAGLLAHSAGATLCSILNWTAIDSKPLVKPPCLPRNGHSSSVANFPSLSF